MSVDAFAVISSCCSHSLLLLRLSKSCRHVRSSDQEPWLIFFVFWLRLEMTSNSSSSLLYLISSGDQECSDIITSSRPRIGFHRSRYIDLCLASAISQSRNRSGDWPEVCFFFFVRTWSDSPITQVLANLLLGCNSASSTCQFRSSPGRLFWTRLPSETIA